MLRERKKDPDARRCTAINSMSSHFLSGGRAEGGGLRHLLSFTRFI